MRAFRAAVPVLLCTLAACKPQEAAATGTSTSSATPTTTPPPNATSTSTATSAPAAAPVRVPDPADNGHARVGADKCKACHRIQYDSWSASRHVKLGPDCEGCHGGGADYRRSAVMKNKARAVAAGLVFPKLEFCKTCHAKADATLLPRSHAHKPR
jgi:hypothetical protein